MLLARRTAEGVHAWAPFFIYYHFTKEVNLSQKTFLTYSEQIEKLKKEKALIINDIPYATSILKKLSYYSLISGYKVPFKSPSAQKFIYGVTFEELVSFYYFDEELRTLFFKYIIHVEKHIKSLISYHFCDKYGENQCEYLNINNYTVTKHNAKDVQSLINSLQNSISLPSHYNYITHYANLYGNVPLWVATNALTFGQISKLYQYIPNDIQYKVSREFENVSERQLHQFIRVLTSCRNVCAHGERLFSFKINETIPDTILHTKLNIPKHNGQFICGKHDLFGVLIALRYLLNENEFKALKLSLTKLIYTALNNCPHISLDKLLQQMGFPENWSKITIYTKI